MSHEHVLMAFLGNVKHWRTLFVKVRTAATVVLNQDSNLKLFRISGFDCGSKGGALVLIRSV